MIATIVEESESGVDTDVLTLRIGTLSLVVCNRTWDTNISVFLQSISIQLMQVLMLLLVMSF